MGRPRKNRIGEYAGLLAEELEVHFKQEILKTIGESQRLYQEQIDELREEIEKLSRKLETATKKTRAASRARVGKWVPGGPGRPPKDAAERIAAFASRQSKDD
jgi:hypothetical protein